MEVNQTSASPDVSNLDVCSAAGGANRAYARTINGVQATAGVINIKSVYGAADDPELTAIEVVPSAPPTGPPTVATQDPPSGATGVSTGAGVSATFSRALDPATVTSSSFTLKKADGTSVPGSVAYNSSQFQATLHPTRALAAATAYTATLPTAIKASDGTAMSAPVSWTFTTGSAPQIGAVRINAGGPAYTAVNGNTFLADQFFTGGGTYSTTSGITGTND